MEIGDFAFEAVEVTFQALSYVALVLLLRALGRAITGRQLTFYKVYGSNISSLFFSSFLDFARSDQRFRIRGLYVLVLACYTTAIAILFGSQHARMLSVREELMFVTLYLAGVFIQLLLPDDEARSLRTFLFVPLAALLLWMLIIGTELHFTLPNFSAVFAHTYLGLTSVPAFLTFGFSIAFCFLFVSATQTKCVGWQKLVQDVGAVALISPVLVTFVNEGAETTWFSIILWSIKGGALLILFDVLQKFFPHFGVRQPEMALVKIAFPFASVLILTMWLLRVPL